MEREVIDVLLPINHIAAPLFENRVVFVFVAPSEVAPRLYRVHLAEGRPLAETITGLRLRAHDVKHAVADQQPFNVQHAAVSVERELGGCPIDHQRTRAKVDRTTRIRAFEATQGEVAVIASVPRDEALHATELPPRLRKHVEPTSE